MRLGNAAQSSGEHMRGQVYSRSIVPYSKGVGVEMRPQRRSPIDFFWPGKALSDELYCSQPAFPFGTNAGIKARPMFSVDCLLVMRLLGAAAMTSTPHCVYTYIPASEQLGTDHGFFRFLRGQTTVLLLPCP